MAKRHQHSWSVGVEGAQGWKTPGTADAHAYEVCPCGARSALPHGVDYRYVERAGHGLVRVLGGVN